MDYFKVLQNVTICLVAININKKFEFCRFEFVRRIFLEFLALYRHVEILAVKSNIAILRKRRIIAWVRNI